MKEVYQVSIARDNRARSQARSEKKYGLLTLGQTWRLNLITQDTVSSLLHMKKDKHKLKKFFGNTQSNF